MPTDRGRHDRPDETRRDGDRENSAVIAEALSASETWATPPTSVAGGVFEAIADEAARMRRWPLRRVSLWRRWAAASVAVAVGIAALAVFSGFGTDPVTAQLAGTDLFPSASGTATIEPTGAGWSILLDLDLPPAEDGHYYEGWVWNEAGEGVSIGTFHLNEADERLSLWSGVDIEEYPMVWVSLQKIGGGPELSDRVVLRGSIDG